MAFTVSIIEKTKVDVKDSNNAFIGQRVWGHATILLDDYLEHYGLTLNAAAFGLNTLLSLFIQSVDVQNDYASANNDTVSFDWDPTTGTLMAFANDDGAAVADDGLNNMYIRVFFIGT